MDKDKRHLIALGLSIAEGRTIARKRLRQMENVSLGNDPAQVGINIRQLKAVETCYNICSKTNQNNRHS